MPNLDHIWMRLAEDLANKSYCERSKVGAVIVTRQGGVYPGYNGAIAKHYPNVCEHDNVTLPWISHAEENALDKMLREGVSAHDAECFVTFSPCEVCARRIVNSGIRRVVYKEPYRITTGLDILKACNILTEKWEDIECLK